MLVEARPEHMHSTFGSARDLSLSNAAAAAWLRIVPRVDRPEYIRMSLSALAAKKIV